MTKPCENCGHVNELPGRCLQCNWDSIRHCMMAKTTEPIVLTSSDKIHIKGKEGLAYMLKAPFEISVEQIKRDGVIMDGEYKKVRGIERFVVHIGKPVIQEGESIGLLLTDVEET